MSIILQSLPAILNRRTDRVDVRRTDRVDVLRQFGESVMVLQCVMEAAEIEEGRWRFKPFRNPQADADHSVEIVNARIHTEVRSRLVAGGDWNQVTAGTTEGDDYFFTDQFFPKFRNSSNRTQIFEYRLTVQAWQKMGRSTENNGPRTERINDWHAISHNERGVDFRLYDLVDTDPNTGEGQGHATLSFILKQHDPNPVYAPLQLPISPVEVENPYGSGLNKRVLNTLANVGADGVLHVRISGNNPRPGTWQPEVVVGLYDIWDIVVFERRLNGPTLSIGETNHRNHYFQISDLSNFGALKISNCG